MAQAAIYARISLDRKDGEGVARQLADCRKLAAKHGHTSPLEYVDNDVSAYGKKKRPEWVRLLADLASGQISAVYAYHPDRLYRRPMDLEGFIDVVTATGADVFTVQAGDYDLSSASGRMVARIIGASNRHEVERMSERIKRVKLERATQGRPAGGGRRPAGLTARRDGLVAAEVAYLRDAARNILTGSSWHAEVRRLHDEGHLTPAGKPWTIGTLRRTLTSPYIAGLRSYKGQIVGDASWPAILDRDTWEALRSGSDTRRRGRPPSDRRLLTGLIRCERCDLAMYANVPVKGGWTYRCPPGQSTTGRGCSRAIVGDPADRHVLTTVGDWLTHPDFTAALADHLGQGQEDTVTRAELDEVEARIRVLAGLRDAGTLQDIEHQSAKRPWVERREQLLASLAGTTADLDPSGFAAAWSAAIEAAALPDLRAMVALVAEPIMVRPHLGTDGHRRSISERLDLQPRFSL